MHSTGTSEHIGLTPDPSDLCVSGLQRQTIDILDNSHKIYGGSEISFSSPPKKKCLPHTKIRFAIIICNLESFFLCQILRQKRMPNPVDRGIGFTCSPRVGNKFHPPPLREILLKGLAIVSKAQKIRLVEVVCTSSKQYYTLAAKNLFWEKNIFDLGC